MSTEMSCHFIHLLQVSKNIFEAWFYIFFFHDLIHGAGPDSPQGTKCWCHQKGLITLPICCKFKKKFFEVWFYTFLSWFNTWGRGRQSPGDKMLMWPERPYHFTRLLQVSKKSLWSLILYFFFHDLIHVYSTGVGGIQPPRDKVMMTIETSCHFGHLLRVSNHRWQLFLKNPLFYLFPIQKHKGPNLTLP